MIKFKQEPRRIGTFYIHRANVEFEPWKLRQAFRKVDILIIECVFDYPKDCFKYTAIGNEFEILLPGFEIPVYEMSVHAQDGTVTGVFFKKQ